LIPALVAKDILLATLVPAIWANDYIMSHLGLVTRFIMLKSEKTDQNERSLSRFNKSSSPFLCSFLITEAKSAIAIATTAIIVIIKTVEELEK